MKPVEFQRAVLRWFDQFGRKDLPWQQDINPYRVWVSEIMLQQTQVTAVIPYFQRFMQSFPTVQALAAAEQGEVLAHWSGLGYYARARNLHKCAIAVMEQHAGEFPRDVEQLAELPGIGRSTAGAIASISMGLSAPILDGNVKRVLARFYAVPGWPGQSAVAKQLWALAEELTPTERCNDYTQVMMDLGATVCTRSKPRCGECPLARYCAAHQAGNPQEYPGKKPKKEKPVRAAQLLLVLNDRGQIWLEPRPPSGIWGGLWSLPETDNTGEWLSQQGLALLEESSLPAMRHTFTHFHLDIDPLVLKVDGTAAAIVAEGGGNWYNLADFDAPRAAQKLGVPAPVVKLVQQLLALDAPLLALQ
ncbi:A/G-specific adenine glycosylase [Biformimicrobium ophioploci]|uniref:Adenine DNA glycosylase n=1 Tax=Biformimicrobium ophioploci TaxID=3036711 RepID=A0ABQ6LW68_9GAMM|nr:A/G-specific adenine glycosylase [Microbulbifer sp. NKW57]GMG86262.1 A/G-specific adenine glycosylase [Microbulbifer sp. NKW57]